MTASKRRQQRLAGFEDDGQLAGEPSSVSGETPADVPAGSTGEQPGGVDVERCGSAAGLEPGPAVSGRLDLAGKTVYVIDAHSLIYQVFHALPEMTGPAGQPVGAIYGFLRDIVDLLERRQPDCLLCAFDAPGPTFRHALDVGYKATRPEMPLDLQLQIPNIERFLQALAIPVLVLPGYEADDILATVARQVEAAGGFCYLVTSDKDCRQLITDRVLLYNIRKDAVVDGAAVEQEWGIRPAQVVDFQALWGDATDNIAGVPGIGRKTAGQLLARYGTLEGIYERLEEVQGPKRRESLAASREILETSRELVRLADDVPLVIDWHAAHVGGVARDRVRALCAEFGFQRVGDRLTGLEVTSAPADWSSKYETVTTEAHLAALVETLAGQARIAVDTETTALQPCWAEIVGYSFSWGQEGRAAYVPVRAPAGEPHLDPDRVAAALRPLLEDPRIEKVGQNLKYDMVVLAGAGTRLAGVACDTMVADYLLAPGQRNHGLDDLAKRYLNHETIKIRELLGSGKQQKRMDEVPVAQVAIYAAEDANIPLRLAGILEQRLAESALDDLYRTLEIPLISVLAEMERNGVAIDVPRLERLSGEYARRLAELEAEIVTLAGRPFNVDSPKQLAQVLFEELKLPVMKRSKTGPSTDAEVLSQLAREHPLPARVVDYRSCAKLKSTYLDALPALVHPRTGRVHTSFKQDVAATGRLSSTDPNLQNIPVRTDAGREIRAAFVPGEPDWELLCADYSQIELRVLAHFSGDAALVRAFEEQQDIHAQVASEIHQVSLAEVTGEMRRLAKAINFGVVYGQSPYGLAKALGIEKAAAATFIEEYFRRHPGVAAFMDRTLDACRKQGYVTTSSGRRRAVQGVRSAEQRGSNFQRNLPERIAINTVIQGSAADLIKRAMIRVHERMARERRRARLLLQIHDELMLEVPPDERDVMVRLVRDEMVAAGQLDVPLIVDVKIGPNWADCRPVAEATAT